LSRRDVGRDGAAGKERSMKRWRRGETGTMARDYVLWRYF